MKIIITISGPSGAMKSPMARAIARAIGHSRPDLSCTIFDHELYEFDDHFQESKSRVYEDAKLSSHNVCVIVIGASGNDANTPVTVEVVPANPGCRVIFNAVVDCLSRTA